LKISNLCNHNTSTLRTDRQTDRQTTCHSNTALCVASRGKNRRPYNLYCVGGDVKPCSINQNQSFPHLKIPRDAGERKGGTQWYAINVYFKIHVAISAIHCNNCTPRNWLLT